MNAELRLSGGKGVCVNKETIEVKTMLIVVAVMLLVQSQAVAQSEELPKYEVAAEFTTLEREAFSERRTEPGFGARFTYNLNKVFSLEGAGYFFPKKCFSCLNSGNVAEGLAGVKVGKRFEKWGIFAKARPGAISFSQGALDVIVPPGTSSPFDPVDFNFHRLTAFAMDVGGGVELYCPSKRIVTRFDVGDTIVHFNPRNMNTIVFNPVTNTISQGSFTIPGRTSHNFQFMTSVGFRF
jgi:hypothetical protein